MISYVKNYWIQIKSFYRHMWMLTFSRDRNLSGSLKDFQTNRGFIWQMLDVHLWVLRTIWMFIRNLFQLLFCYVAAAIILFVFLIAPLIILIAFPVFSYKRHQRLRREGAAL